MNNLKPGDTVRLKSGGPTMTVAEVGQGKAYCQWFNQSGGEYSIQAGSFQFEQLKQVDMQS